MQNNSVKEAAKAEAEEYACRDRKLTALGGSGYGGTPFCR